ncbi:MAG TPA: Gfo/Idh/MocA family oxidoreductase [Stellaceae bacterium]|jgi:predicted dehydrogenase|nr:Gfo/Idh/MocA family oxidoreductase [Stellaceae bacterium]
MKPVRFAAIGLNHFHIYGQIDLLLRAGAEFVAYCGEEEKFFAKPFSETYPQARRVDDPRRILDDDSIALVVSAAVNSERAPLGVAVMRHGKDFMVDKPGVTSLAQLAELRKVQAETRRIYSICYSEHFETRSTVKAGELLRAGTIGRLVNTVGLGPHRLNKPRRPNWFFQREASGGILTDIASHQCEQFLFFTDRSDAELVAATVANRTNPDHPEFQDFGEILLRTPEATGYIRVDWLTPDGLPTWGDGRLTLIGTEGYMELRKYVDIGGAAGGDHLFLVDRKNVQRIDCSAVELPYGRLLVDDIVNRTETAMPQARCFGAAELALTAQALAERKR